MSSGTSAGNIVTEVPGTYAARTWRSVVKLDAYGAIMDAQLANIIGANWFNNVDDNLAQLNNWLNGTGIAASIKAAAGEFGALSLSGDIAADNLTLTGDVDAVNADFSGTLDALTAVVGTGVKADATAAADDLVIGALEAVDHGVTILSTSVARVAFADVANTSVGYLSYTHSSNTLGMGIAGSTVLNLGAAALSPGTNNTVTLGSSALRFANAHSTNLVVYDSAQVGDGTARATISFDRDTAQTSEIAFKVEGVQEYGLKLDGTFFSIERYSAGVYADAVSFDRVVGGFYVPNDLFINEGDIDMSADSAQILMGGGVAPAIIMRGNQGSNITWKNVANSPVFSMVVQDDDFTMTCSATGESVFMDGVDGGIYLPNVTIGDNGTTEATLALSKSAAGTSRVQFLSSNIVRWALGLNASEDLLLECYDATGVLQNTITMAAVTGGWTMPVDLTVTGGKIITIGDGTNGAQLFLNKNDAGNANVIFQNISVTRWITKMNSSENLLFERYNSSGVLQDTTTVSNSDGSWSFPAGIGVSGQTRRLTSGTGAPAAAATNGDIYWRIDGTISTTIYVRIAGVWTAMVGT